MNVQNVKMNTVTTNNNRQNKKQTSFKATPKQISEAIQKNMLEDNVHRTFIEVLNNIFTGFEKSFKEGKNLPDKFEYKLLEPNLYSKEMANLTTEETVFTFRGFDKMLKKSKILGYDMSKTTRKVYLNKVLKELGVEKPDVIEFSK